MNKPREYWLNLTAEPGDFLNFISSEPHPVKFLAPVQAVHFCSNIHVIERSYATQLEERVQELEFLLSNIRSEMCWLSDRYELPSGLISLHNEITKALKREDSK